MTGRITCTHVPQLPGASGFPLRTFFTEPTDRKDQGLSAVGYGGHYDSPQSDELKGYLAQMRMEVGSRLAKRIIDPKTKRVSKVCVRSLPGAI